MRLLRLELERFGPFTGRTLHFREDASLHVVYGPNEAGKSSALAAIKDLLFGFERQTDFDFLHEGKDLRIGAEIADRQGRRMAFRRRKGNKNTLIDAADASIGDDALSPFLGSLTRPVFCRAFGLNAEDLRAGAEEMLKSEGDVGASLFAAASGLRGLTDVRQSLEAEATGIFAPRAAKDRRFYQAYERFDTAHKTIRALELKASDWKALNARIEALAGELDKIRAERAAKAAERARLSRLKSIAPLLGRIDAHLGDLEDFGDLPEVENGFAARLRRALAAAEVAQDRLEHADIARTRATRDLDAVAVDGGLLAHAAELGELVEKFGTYTDAARDLPRIRAEAEQYDRSLRALAVRLGLPSDAPVEARIPSDAALALVRSLLEEGGDVARDLARQGEALGSEESTLEDLQRERRQRGALVDPAPLKVRFAAFAPLLKGLERRVALKTAIQAEERDLLAAGQRLKPGIVDLGCLDPAALPDAGSIEGAREALANIGEAIRREQAGLEELASGLARSEARILALAEAGPVPSAEAIAAARIARDALWAELRTSLFEAEGRLQGAARFEALRAFERAVEDADRLADAQARDAKRVADHGAEVQAAARNRAALAQTEARLAGLRGQEKTERSAWAGLWSGCGVVPLTPAEMLVWRSAVDHLLERLARLREQRSDLAAIDEQFAGIEPSLRNLAAETGLSDMGGLDLGLLVARLEGRLGEIGESWDRARDLETRIRSTEARVARTAALRDVAVGRQAEWRGRWEKAVAAIGLEPDAALEQAAAALAAWDKVPDTRDERDNRLRRVRGMERNIEAFELKARDLAASLAPDLKDLSADSAVKAMLSRLEVAQKEAVRREEGTSRLAQARVDFEEAEQSLAEGKQEVGRLCRELPSGADVARVLDGLERRERLREALGDLRAQLVDVSGGRAEEDLRAELAGFDPDATEAALAVLSDEEAILERRGNETYAEHDREIRRRTALEAGVGAEVALQQKRSAEAELADAAREWLVLKLGAQLIGKAIEQHRAGQQDPMMKRAAALFSELTGGDYEGLNQEYDDNDLPRLVGRRLSGSPVPIAGMSEGTRDQLYLALRLAYLEDFAGRSEPAPFIGDDLFATFDDRRTAHGLKALADIGGRVQPILFTHHQHVVELARETLGSKVDALTLA
ncbi:Uncharacterized protein YhaN [Faunimonas pinastri]|uniref:Uncharacterized protein YhaN n=1 Tax=Faunimonas pinastri TaxID=1855383 RepID=A0A1H8Z159_9HYPH|nr:YhaN family protein [Faunimonas pinastri]SEP58150.1 Uncharacterized protein YhaN [Faunimonas pinastri]